MNYRMSIKDRLQAICRANTERKGQPLRITILGAGMAGLAAAYELECLGHEVTIIEARHRAGGRVETWRPAGPNGPVHEFGAMRLPIGHDFTYHYIERLGLTTKLRPFITAYKEPDAFYYIRGRKFKMNESGVHVRDLYDLSELDYREISKIRPDNPDTVPLVGIILDQVFEPLKNRLTEADRKALICEGPETDFARELDRTTLGEYVRHFLRGSDAQDLAGVISALDVWWHKSAAMFLRETFLGDETDLNELSGGLDQLPERLEKSLKCKVRYNRAVVAIDNRPDKVILHLQPTHEPTGDPSEQHLPSCPLIEKAPRETIEAELVLCTIPFSVLRGTALTGVTAKKQAAIRSLSYASSTKVLLHCAKRVWEPDIIGGATLSDTILRSTYYPSDSAQNLPKQPRTPKTEDETIFWVRTAPPLQKPAGFSGYEDKPAVLVASYNWDKDARRLGAIPYAQRPQVCLEILEQLHPGISETVIGSASRFWDEQPWARGAFAFAEPGEIPEHFANGRQPEGRLYFAGEHLSFNQGWIQGALKSALIASQHILEDW